MILEGIIAKRRKKMLALARDQNKVLDNMNVKKREELLTFRSAKKVKFLKLHWNY